MHSSGEPNSGIIETLLHEERVYAPSPEFVAQANINDPSVYESAERDPLAFWMQAAGRKDPLAHAESRARAAGLKSLFVLSTRTTHWFIERGFVEADTARLPERKQALYNYERRSKVFWKEI